MANYGQTILGSWDQAGAMDLRNQQARAAQRENEMAEYDSVTNELITRGVLRTDNGIYMDIDKLNELPAGGVANILDFGLRGTALNKYTGLDDRLKQGKVSSLTKVTEENYDRLQLKDKDGKLLTREEAIGKFAVGIKNEKGIMKFIGRRRKEGDDTPVLFEGEDISKILDAGAQRMMSKTTAGGRTAFGTAAKQKGETDYNRSVTMLGQQMFDEAGRGGQDEEDRIQAEIQQILAASETDDSPEAPVASAASVATLISQQNINSNNQGKTIVGDGEKVQTVTRRGRQVPVNIVSEEDRDPKPEINLEGTPQNDKGKYIFRDQTIFGRKGARYSTQGKLDAVRKEIMENLDFKGNSLMVSAGMAASLNITNNETRALFKALGLPTKIQDLSKAQYEANQAGPNVDGPWDKALKELDRIQGVVDGEVPVTGDQTGRGEARGTISSHAQGPARLRSTTNDAETVEEAQTVIAAKIDRQEKPEPEEVQKLRELLEANEVKTLEDYKKIAAKELSPQDLIAANWIVASIGTESMAEVQNNMTMLSNITATGFPDYSYQEMIDDKNTAYSQVTARMNAMSTAAGKGMSNTARQNQFLKDIEPTYALRRDFTLDMESGSLSNADGEVINRDQHRQKMSLTIENLRRSLNSGAYGPRGSADYLAATKEIDKQTAQFIQHAAAQQEGVGRTGDKIKDFFINPDTPFYVDGGLKNLRIKNTRRGPMFVYGTTNYKGDFTETDNSILVGGIVATVFGSDEEFMRFVERNQIKNTDTNEVWTN
tara:strand:+ start:1570 stop:3885 length:2316 start_codon:yes stop_codon:yes gene_type:complete